MGRKAKRRREQRDAKKREQRLELANRVTQQKTEQDKIRQGYNVGKTPEGQQVASDPRFQVAKDAAAIFKHVQGKKIVAFLQDAMDCCTEKCIIEYTESFNRDGYACLMVPVGNFQDILKYLSNYVVLFRTGWKAMPPGLLQNIISYVNHLRGLGIRVVYYADDLIFFANNKAPLALIGLVDAVIVTNEILRDVLVKTLKIAKPVIIVPTHMNIRSFDSIQPPPGLFSDRFKVLMTSSGRIGINHLYEIAEIANEIPELAENVEWVLNCQGVAQIRSVINKFRNLKKTYIDWVPLAGYYAIAKSVDCIIHPAREDDLAYLCPPEMQKVWLDSKSELKYTVAGAAKIPIISSPTYSYNKAITDGVTGFLANTPEEFVEKIRTLLQDQLLCKRVGQAARKDIEDRYDITKRYPTYRDAIIGKIDPKTDFLGRFFKKSKSLFIPPIEGGPRTFYENMKRTLPAVSDGSWTVADRVQGADAAVAIAFVAAQEILAEKAKNANLKIIYRLDGLPTNFQGELEPTNLAFMQDMFKHVNKIVWQSQHCLDMWKAKKLIPEGIDPGNTIIHNGVDTKIFSSTGDLFEFPNPKKYNFLNLNWSTFPHKRLDLLKQAISYFADREDVHFYLIGNYFSTSQIANVNYWKEFKNVTYIGRMANQSEDAKKILASIYRTARALIFTSEMEGSPNTVLEALGCGCPVIYNEGATIVPEILADHCIPFKHFDAIFDEEIVEGIRSSYKTILPNYTMEKCAEKYLELIK